MGRPHGMRDPSLRVAVVNDYEIVVEGLAAMLERFDDIAIVDRVTVGEELSRETIDVVLYDTFGRDGVFSEELATLVATPRVRHVAVFTLSWTDGLTGLALERGVSGVLSKSLDREALATGLRRIADGAVVVMPPERSPSRHTTADRDWPGRLFKLSERESEVVVLVAEGLRNQEIARALDLSEDTVKTHLKRAYRKLGVANRAQATSLAVRDPAFRLERHEMTEPEDSGRPA